jgi:molybdate transport system regulatory protein
MVLSIRNQFDGDIVTVTRGEVMGIVLTRLSGGQQITAAITLDAIDDLGLAAGRSATILIKSTEVAVATGPVGRVSIRNLIPGTVSAVDFGAVMTTVRIEIGNGQTITAAITKDAAEEMSLAVGDRVTALVKSTEVSISVN